MFIIWQVTMCAAQFAAVCAMTRVVRGWRVTLAAFALYALLYTLYDWACAYLGITPLAEMQLRFAALWPCFILLIVLLSRDAIGRKLFLALDYGAYLAAIVPLCQVFTLWQPPFLKVGGGICAVAVLILAHILFIYLLLPLVPRSNRRIPWRIASLTAAALFILLYATGIWPHALVTGDWPEWVAFGVASVVTWVVFPMMYAGMRAYVHNQGVAHNLSQMVAEVALWREAIEATRRQRHDLRHHRIVLAEHLLRGQTDQALDYLESLDQEAHQTPTDKLIWCENDTLNAILSGLSRLAQAKGVVFEVTANVSRTVGVPEIDLVALVANLVENAIQSAARLAAKKTAESREKYRVCVTLRQRERTFGMTVTNPVPPDFALSKEGLPSAQPGIGLESVRRVIQRQAGELIYTLADGLITCQAMLQIRESEKKHEEDV